MTDEVPEWKQTAPHAFAPDAPGQPAFLHPSDVGADDWVRIVPEHPELAATRSRQSGSSEKVLVVDRKLLPDRDLLYPGAGPSIIASERLLESLVASGAGGWRAMPVRHVGTGESHAPAAYELELLGTCGPFVAGQPSRYETPVPPVAVDGTRRTTDSIGWSDWMYRKTWRAVIARGRIVREFHARNPGASPLVLLPVDVHGEPAVAPVEPSPQWTRAPTPGPVPTLDASFSALGSGGHVLPPGTDDAAVSRAFVRLGLPTTVGLARWLALTNGAVLFDGALAFFPIGSVGDEARARLQFEASDILSENAATTKASSGLLPPAGTVLFARSHDGEVFWGVDADDRVYGYGRGSPELGGYVYGAGLPFDAWLADFVADLG